MAEIKVERKKQTPIWPWILGILILLGLIWFLIEAFNEESELENEPREFEVEEGAVFIPESEEQAVSLEIARFNRV